MGGSGGTRGCCWVKGVRVSLELEELVGWDFVGLEALLGLLGLVVVLKIFTSSGLILYYSEYYKHQALLTFACKALLLTSLTSRPLLNVANSSVAMVRARWESLELIVALGSEREVSFAFFLPPPLVE